MLNLFIINPVGIWIRWLIFKLYLEHKNSEKYLRIGYLSFFKNCQFGQYNTLYDNVSLSNVSLGDFTYISGNTKIMNTTIGKFCSIANEVLIGLAKHPSNNFASSHPIFFSTLKQAQITFVNKTYFQEYADIFIGHDVWIGARAVVVDGIRIGNGAIIAAGAVVTKDVPPYAIVGGVPAKIIRYRFSEEDIVFLEDFCWWHKDYEFLKTNFCLMHDIQKLKKWAQEAGLISEKLEPTALNAVAEIQAADQK